MTRAEKAVDLKRNGYNCAQSVLCAFSDEIGLDEETLKKLGAAFCVGMGSMEGTCGALCAAEMILGLKKFEGRAVIRESRNLLNEFKAKAGATACRDLKGVDTGKVLCPCNECVRIAAELAEKIQS
ncbi:MAG: C_GCAxxG_C_C family protein [Erysipelotrichales bacterium]|nr:C_GCAxxG_C_C family protein [Erysipelotrichales bacterium]